MAEHAAHLTSSGLLDANRPSIFEVLAQQSLMSTIRPAMQHAVRVFAEKYPEKLGGFLRHFDELYLLFDTLVQSYYLKKYGGSFAENFYDLKRLPSHNPELPSLSSKLRLRCVACLVLIPYIRQKLDNLFEELRYREGTDTRASAFLQRHLNLKQRLVRMYLLFYPYIHSVWELLTLTYSLSFMLRGGRWHSPSMHLSGTELHRLDREDLTNSEGMSGLAWSELSAVSKLAKLAKMSLDGAALCLSTSLSVGVFFLQFLDWWYASDSSAPSLTALPIPSSPKQAKLRDIHPATCPLCLRLRTNSTALAVSGYVFCYPCITEHVRKEKCCPITGYPATTEHLVKIYEQDL